MEEIDLLDLTSRSKKVKEDRLTHSLLAQFGVIPVFRQFDAVFIRDIVPGAADDQDIWDTTELLVGPH